MENHVIMETSSNGKEDIQILWDSYMAFLEFEYCDCCFNKTHSIINWNESVGLEDVVLDEDTSYRSLECIKIMTSLYENVCLTSVVISKCENCTTTDKDRHQRLEFYENICDDLRWIKGDYILVDGYCDQIKMRWSNKELDPERNSNEYRKQIVEQILCDSYMWKRTRDPSQMSEKETYSDAVSDLLTYFVVTKVLKFGA